jgi:hypothetical protein
MKYLPSLRVCLEIIHPKTGGRQSLLLYHYFLVLLFDPKHGAAHYSETSLNDYGDESRHISEGGTS